MRIGKVRGKDLAIRELERMIKMDEHIVRIRDIAKLLKGLNRPFVFVGGATVALYATFLNLTEDVRPTEDPQNLKM